MGIKRVFRVGFDVWEEGPHHTSLPELGNPQFPPHSQPGHGRGRAKPKNTREAVPEGYSTMAWTPFFLKITILCTGPQGLQMV